MDEHGNIEVRSGLGGWLILVGVGVVFGPLMVLGQFLALFPPLFLDGTFEELTSAASESYIPFWGPLVIVEFLSAIFVCAVSLYIVFLFFSKKRTFRKIYIFLAIYSFVALIVDALLVQVIVPDAVFFDSGTINNLVRSGMVLVIWVPYLLKSERVKATFVN